MVSQDEAEAILEQFIPVAAPNGVVLLVRNNRVGELAVGKPLPENTYVFVPENSMPAQIAKVNAEAERAMQAGITQTSVQVARDVLSAAHRQQATDLPPPSRRAADEALPFYAHLNDVKASIMTNPSALIGAMKGLKGVPFREMLRQAVFYGDEESGYILQRVAPGDGMKVVTDASSLKHLLAKCVQIPPYDLLQLRSGAHAAAAACGLATFVRRFHEQNKPLYRFAEEWKGGLDIEALGNYGPEELPSDEEHAVRNAVLNTCVEITEHAARGTDADYILSFADFGMRMAKILVGGGQVGTQEHLREAGAMLRQLEGDGGN